MPRFFFNIHDGVALLDKEGTELHDLTAARREAAYLFAELIEEAGRTRRLGSEWSLEVTDETGLILFSMHFAVPDATTNLLSSFTAERRRRRA